MTIKNRLVGSFHGAFVFHAPDGHEQLHVRRWHHDLSAPEGLLRLGRTFSRICFWGYAMLGCICYSLLCIAWRMNEKELADLRAAAGGEDPEGPRARSPFESERLACPAHELRICSNVSPTWLS